MKIRRSSMPSTTHVQESASPSTASTGSTQQAEKLASVDIVDRTDRFEVGNTDPDGRRDDQKEPEEADELLQESMEDPLLFQELTRSALIGTEELPPSIETTWNGVATLLDTDRE